MFSFNRAAQRAQMDLAEALSLRKPVAPVPPSPSPFAVQHPSQPAQQTPAPMPQPMAQMPSMPQGMPYQAPQPVSAGMPGLGQISPYGQAQSGQPSLRFARGGSVRKPLSYEDLSPAEKNIVDYHRRNLEAGIAQRNADGSGTSLMGAIEDLNNKPTYFPTFWNGKVLPLEQAKKRALNSGIEFPTYPDYDTALAREKAIHDDIMSPDMDRFLAVKKKRGGSVSIFAVKRKR